METLACSAGRRGERTSHCPELPNGEKMGPDSSQRCPGQAWGDGHEQ